jgi:hypothetical protein
MLRPFGSITTASGILDHPLSRMMTVVMTNSFTFQTAVVIARSKVTKQSSFHSRKSLDCFAIARNDVWR